MDDFENKVLRLCMHGLMNIIYDTSNKKGIDEGLDIMAQCGFEPRDEESFKKISDIVKKHS